MRVAMLAPIAWRTPPRHYGPWELVTSLLTEALVALGVEVTLFATLDSLTSARLDGVVPAPYEEDPSIDAKVWEYRHLSHLFAQAERFDLIHNQADFPAHAFAPLVRTPMVSTIHGFSSERILPMYQPFADRVHFVAISNADRHPLLPYAATIHHGVPVDSFSFEPDGGDSLLYFGRIHPHKGAADAIEVARRCAMPLDIYGIVQDRTYFEERIVPAVDGSTIRYAGPVGGPARIRALGKARALLHLIHFEEPFGLSVVEAMACGTPVIAMRRGSMPELIEHGVNGFLVSCLEEAVEAVGRIGEIDRATCRRIAQERFSTDRMARDYLSLYQRILADPATPGGTLRPPRGFSSRPPHGERAMPAKSAAQQKAAGAALSAKRGETSKSKLKGASKSMASSMSEKQLEELASTKRKGKPEHAARRGK